jgi:Mrp family chromosome partitioning ATPase
LRTSAIRDNREIAIPPNRKFHGENMIIGLLNQKGGVGKTTLAVHIADALARRNKKGLLVYADTQG